MLKAPFSIYKSFISRAGIAAVYLIPVFGCLDFFISIGILPGVPGRGRPDNPFPLLVAGKDGLTFFLFLLLVISAFRRGKLKKLSAVLVLVGLILSIYSNTLLLLIAGIRETSNLIYVAVGICIANSMTANGLLRLEKFTIALKITLAVEFFMSMLQLRFMPGIEGTTLLGSRVVGSFTNPNTIGVFGALVILLLELFTSPKEQIGRIYYLMSALIVYASGSRAAVLLLAFVILIRIFRILSSHFGRFNAVNITALSSLVSVPLILVNINLIASKPRGLSISEGVRAANLLDYISSSDLTSLLIGRGWGVHTSWHYSLAEIVGTSFQDDLKLDSFYASMLVQIGLIGFLALTALLWWLFSQGGGYGKVLFFATYLIGFQVNILEYYPISMLIFISLGILMVRNYQNKNPSFAPLLTS